MAAIRSVLAVPGFALLAWLYRGKTTSERNTTSRRNDLLLALFAGFLCYYLGALANFYALTIVDASVERPLLFAYPLFVVIITTLGVVLVTGALNARLSVSQWSGMAWILFCSLSIAIYTLISGELTQRLGSGLFTFTAMSAAAVGMAVHYQIFAGWENVDLSVTAWWTLTALVVFSTVLPLFLMAEGVRTVGAAKASLISTLGPPATAIMAQELTSEVLAPAQWLGIALVLIGVMALEVRRQRPT